jgi:hypothetical protein
MGWHGLREVRDELKLEYEAYEQDILLEDSAMKKKI